MRTSGSSPTRSASPSSLVRASKSGLSRMLLSLAALGALAACRVDLPASPAEVARLVEVTPPQGHVAEAHAVTLVAENLAPRVRQDLGAPDGVRVDASFAARLGDTALADVEYVDEQHLRAVVPAGMAAGSHTLVVTTPFGEELTLANAYLAFDAVPPVVLSVTPPALVNDADTTLTISGSDFASADELGVELLRDGADPVVVVVESASEGELTTTVPAGTAAGSYAVQVTQAGLSAKLEDAVFVYDPAALVVTVLPSAATVSVGQSFSVEVSVENVGGSAALGVSVPALTVSGQGAATQASGPTPASADLDAGASATFPFHYDATSTGALSFAASASGENEHSARALSADADVVSVQVQTAPSLSGTLSLPATLSAGHTFEVTLLVENSGQATASAVLPSALVANAGGDVNATLVSAPAAADVPPGEPVPFVWQYSLDDGLGTLSFAGDAAGTDANSAAAVSTGTFTSNSADVVEGAVLVSAVSAPPFISLGSNFNVVVEVQNVGGADALVVAPQSAPAPSVPDLVHYVSGPVPASATVAGAGGSVSFSYTFAADAEGTFTFAVSAAGTDVNSGDVVSSHEASSAAVVVQPPPNLSAVLSAPSPLSEGQTFTVTMALTNYGGSDLSDVQPSLLTQDPAGAATLVSAPTAPFPTLAADGGVAELTWTYVAGSAGAFTFSGTASGTDVDSAATVTSPVAQSNVVLVQVPPLFVLDWTTPASVTRGQPFDVTLTVQNAGEVTAEDAAPGTLTVGGSTGTTCGAATPASGALAAGAQTSFTWSCTAGATSGAATFTTTVSGTDANSDAVIPSAPASSDDVIVQSPALLSLAWTLPPTDVSYGQVFDVTLVLSNAGEASATASAGAISALGTTGTTCGAAAPASVSVPGNDSASVVYSCTAGGTSGDVTFSASVSGSEDNSAATVSAGPTSSAPLVVESPPLLSASFGTLPTRVSFDEAFAAELTVRNDGEAPAASVAPAGFVVNGSGTTCTGPTPADASIAPAAQQVFTYACTGGAPAASATLSAGASGSDANAASGVTADAASSAPVLVGSAAALDVVSVSAVNDTVYRRQSGVRVELSVQNLGEASADVVSAADWLVFTAAGVDVSDEYTVVPLAGNPTQIAGGASELFSFDVSVAAAATLGPVLLDGAASGADVLDGSTTSDAGATTTDAWNVAVNQPPVACFVSDFTAREVNQSFSVDASCSTDLESGATLSIEWDWENDGTFDTAPSTTRTATHAYAADGLYTIALRVTDAIGFTSYATFTVSAAAAGRLRLVTTTDANGVGSLLEAAAAANNNPGADTIAFDRALFDGTPRTITLFGGQNLSLTDAGTRLMGHTGVRVSARNGISLAGDGNVLAYLEVSSSNDSCIDVAGDDNRVIGTRVDACDRFGLVVSGTGNSIGPGNSFPGNYGDRTSIELRGASNTVDGNTFRACIDTCVEVVFGAAGQRIVGNLFSDVPGDGIVLRGGDHQVLHNTLHGVSGTAVDVLFGTGNSVRNNIFSNVFGGAVCGSDTDVSADYNDLFQVLPDGCEATQGPNSISADPLYNDAAGGDFTLAETSPCLDVGDAAVAVDVNGAGPALYDGAAPDLGAFERNAP